MDHDLSIDIVLSSIPKRLINKRCWIYLYRLKSPSIKRKSPTTKFITRKERNRRNSSSKKTKMIGRKHQGFQTLLMGRR